jgi:DNA repair exonuclease SbcCD nuclease subunit
VSRPSPTKISSEEHLAGEPKMKILHLADTHLGYTAYNKLDPDTGINQREQDVYNTFEHFVDYALESKPDLILHAGDLFDTVRPSNRAIAHCLEQLLRLSREGIPIVLISGNHSTPRLRETGSVFRLMEHLEHVYPVYKGVYEQVKVPQCHGVIIHALPHATSEEVMKENLEAFKPEASAELNIGLLHGAVTGVREFKSGEFNEQTIASGYLKPSFDYIALGHYHEFVEVEKNAYYSGSAEKLSFNEVAHTKKGFIELELEKGKLELKYVELTARPMVELPRLDCSELTNVNLSDEIVKRIEASSPEGKIIRIKIENISSAEFHSLDFSRIRKTAKDALHFEQINNVLNEDLVYSQGTSPKIDKLSIEFSEFIKNQPVEALDKDKLKEMGLEYISAKEA